MYKNNRFANHIDSHNSSKLNMYYIISSELVELELNDSISIYVRTAGVNSSVWDYCEGLVDL